MKRNRVSFVCWIGVALVFASVPRARAQEDVRISEFMASNNKTLQDEDRDYPDWIELFNAGTNTVNLLNWSLTDSLGNPTKWRFPATNIGPSHFMVVFASNKDRRTPGPPLHTSFKLGASGGYLALFRPDGSVATEFAPAYPPQVVDVSYGFGITQSVSILIATNAAVSAFVPADQSLGQSWRLPGFDDSAWLTGTNGVGYDTGAVNASEDLPASVILASGPAAYWRFNETNGTVATNLGYYRVNGTYQSVALTNAGPRPPAFGGFETNNLAARFTGASTYVATGSNFLNNLAAFTMAAWILPTNTQPPRTGLFGQNDAIEFGFADTTTLQVLTPGGGSLSVPYTSLPGLWHHVVVIGDGASLRLYLDGVLQGTGGSPTTNYGASASPFNIGGGGIFDATGNFFNGQIDELAVWFRALSETEIQQQFQAALNSSAGSSFTNLIGLDLRAAMFGVNSSAYVRYQFNLADPSQVDRLTLRLQYDDGFAAYLNGAPVAWRNAPDDVMVNPLFWNEVATTYHVDRAAVQFETFDISAHVGSLVPGTNVLAIQGLNTSATNSDFLIRTALESTSIGALGTEAGYFKKPTPGDANGLSTVDLGPIISSVGSTPGPPAQPLASDSITVTARVVKSFAPVTNVVLRWRVMFGPTNELPMLDDGLHGDGAAGDGIYGASIPPDVATNGQMLRWIVWASDAGGQLSRWPLFEVPDGSAEYEGTVISDPTLSSKLPIFQIFIDPNSTNWIKPFPSGVPSRGVDAESGGRISLFYNGEFYDNISMALRGNTTAGYPKNSHHVNFNADKPFQHPGPGGSVRHTSFLSEHADPAYLRSYLSFWLLDLMGVPSPFDYPVRFQLNTAFYGLYFHNDPPGPEQLGRLGYDSAGALYKAAGQVVPSYASTGVFEKKNRLNEGREDYDALAYAINEARPAAVRKTNLFDMLNVPEIVNYLATARFTQEGDDVWANMTLYRDSNNTKEWSIIPFDLNVSWGQLYCGDNSSAYNVIVATNDTYKCHPLYGGSQVQQNGSANWNRIYDVIIATPETRQMLLRRERTLMDKFLQPPGTAFSQGIMEQQIAYMTNLMWTEMFLDRQKWGWPCTNVCGMYCWGSPWPTNVDFGAPGLSTGFIGPRRAHWFISHCITNTARPVGLGNALNAGIPFTQPPNAFISVLGVEASPSSANQAQEYVCLTNPTPVALDISGWKLSGAIEFTFKPGTVMPSNSVLYVSPDVTAFRARTTGPRGGQGLFVVGPFQGQLSARGETVRVSDDVGRPVASYTYAGTPSLAQQFLRVTELMYHPAPLAGSTNGPDEFEYLELKNLSASLPIDLTGVRFTNGVAFSFTGSAITTLGPGERVLVVKNLAAFSARYGSLAGVAGAYDGYLDNAGERIQLLDALGDEILDFTYNNTWYPITDGFGFSLVVVDEQAAPDAWNSKANWRPSGQVGGSPGSNDLSAAIVPVVVNEALTRTGLAPPPDSIELFNPTANDADLSGWFLTDDFLTPKKFRIPDGTILAAGSYVVFDESQFDPHPGVAPSFALSGDGDAVFLFSTSTNGDLTGYYHGFSFGAAEEGVAFGRYLTSEGKEHFVSQLALSLGTNNPGPRIGPVVVNEIMYHPPDLGGTNDNAVDEFIELLNISTNSVPLFDGVQPPNTWKITGGVDFTFPTNISLATGEYVLLVNFNPTNTDVLAAFRAKYAVGPNVQIFGPYGGKLNNHADNVELKKPVTPLNGKVPYVLVDKVSYDDSAPWPGGADGFGLSLQRRNSAAFGDEPANWVAAPASAAAPTPAGGTAPAFTTELASQTVAAGSTLTLGVSATGANPLRYQWRFNGVNLSDATNATLQLSGIRPQHAGDYKVLVFNDAGSVVSSNAAITVLFPPTIMTQPTNVTVFPLTSASFSVAALSSTALSYQWRFNGNPIPGATNASLTVTNIQPANDGPYTAAVTDAAGTSVSDVGRLTVVLHPAFTVQPTNRTVIVGASPVNVTLTASATSTTPVTYQWRLSSTNLPGATGASLTITNVQARHAGDYSVVASDNYGPATSTNATLTVLLLPLITQQPQSQIIPFGGSASFNAAASGTLPISFRWRRGLANVAVLTSADGTSIFTTNNLTTNGAYNIAITNIAGPAIGGVSSNGYLYVMVPPTNQAVYSGSDVTFTTAPVGEVPSIAYQWQFNGGALAGATNASLTLTNVQPAAEGNYSVTVTITTNAYVPPAVFTASLRLLPPPPPILSSPQLMPDHSFRMLLLGQASRVYSIEISDNLTNWTPLDTFTSTNASMPFADPTATNVTQRFYRARTGP